MRLGAVDLGSNSFHLLVAECEGANFQRIIAERDVLGLGEIVAATGAISPDAWSRAIECLMHFDAVCRAAEVDTVLARATSAVRDAANGEELLEWIRSELGWDVRLITGEEEAGLVLRAAHESLLLEGGTIACLDLGGGSLEVAVGDGSGAVSPRTLPLGPTRVAAALGFDTVTSNKQRELVEQHVAKALAPIVADFRRLKPTLLVASGGMARDIARATAAARGANAGSVNHSVVRSGDLTRLAGELSADRGSGRVTAGFKSHRVRWAGLGVVIFGTAMAELGFTEMTTTSWGLREGIIVDAICQPPLPAALRRGPGRRQAVLELCERCGYDEGHATQVARLAVSLFDQTFLHHGMGEAERELLELAALLHDVGEHVSSEGHQRHGAYLVQHAGLRGFTPEELDALVTMVRHHRSGKPRGTVVQSPGEMARLAGLTGILRLADGLDRSRRSVVDRLRLTQRRQGLSITVEVHDEATVELRAAARKSQLLARRFGVAIGFDVARPAVRAG